MKEAQNNILPDVVLMDLDMPEMNGITAISESTKRNYNTKFIVLTVFDEDDKIFEAIKVGADGYLLKDEPIEKIKEAIENLIHDEGTPMSPAIARKVLNLLKCTEKIIDNKMLSEKYNNIDEFKLTNREKEILDLLIKGLEYKEIAEKLNISPNTIRNIISKIYKKLHVNSAIKAANLIKNLNYKS